jgi:protein dpy-30
MAEEEEYEEVEEGEEVEDSNNAEQLQPQMEDPQKKNVNIIEQPKAEEKKSINSKNSRTSKVSKTKSNNSKIKKDPSINKNVDSSSKNKSKKSSVKAEKSKVSNLKNDENAYKIPSPEQVVSTRAYLEETVSSVIQEALLELARQRPKNPLEFVGNYILKKAKEK